MQLGNFSSRKRKSLFALAAFGMHRLHEKGSIYMEIHENLGARVLEIFSKDFDVEIKRDMQRKERMVRARKR